jgi:hypothetical protein
MSKLGAMCRPKSTLQSYPQLRVPAGLKALHIRPESCCYGFFMRLNFVCDSLT